MCEGSIDDEGRPKGEDGFSFGMGKTVFEPPTDHCYSAVAPVRRHARLTLTLKTLTKDESIKVEYQPKRCVLRLCIQCRPISPDMMVIESDTIVSDDAVPT